jgi:hypothetical protein
MKEWEFDYKTCAEICRGNNEPMREFAVRAKVTHEDRNSLNSMLNDMRRTLAARDAEIEVLKAALLDAEEKPSNY